MKRNSKKNDNNFANNEKRQKTKQFSKPNNSLLKTNQIPIAGVHSVFSALNNKNRKLNYLITTNTNLSKWKEEINKLKLTLDIKVKTKEEMDKINNYNPHQNVILITEPLQRLSLDEFLSYHRFND